MLKSKRVLSFIMVLCLLAALIPLSPIAVVAEVSTDKTVYAVDSSDILVNPGKGWILYAHPRFWLDGKNPFDGQTAETWAIGTVGYLRYSWGDLEPTEGTYDWSKIDNAMNECVSHGKKFAFGVMSANSSSNVAQDTPQWVFDAGAAFVNSVVTDNFSGSSWTEKVPVWDDPVFMSKLQNFIHALRARYDGNPNIAFIDVRNFGNWGEWHLFGLTGSNDISDAKKREHIDMWSGFQTTPLVIPTLNAAGSQDPQDYAVYAANTYGIGARSDSMVKYTDTLNACTIVYDKAIAVGEFFGTYQFLKDERSWSDSGLENAFNVGKFSYMGLGQWNNDGSVFYSEKKSLIDSWANKMGYWIKMVEATFSESLGNGTTGTVSFKMRNDGVAPIYLENTAVKLALLDSNNNVISTTGALAGVNPFDWKPGQGVTETATFTFPQNALGTKLALGVFSNSSLTTPDIKLGIGNGSNGWYVLSDMPTTPPVSTPTPAPTVTPTPTPTPTPYPWPQIPSQPVNTPPVGIIAVDGMKLWLRAGDITGVANGASVALWPDMSGAGNNAAQDNSTRQPKYIQNEINGKPVVRFDGTDDFLYLGSPSSLAIQDSITVFSVFKSRNTNSNSSRQGIYGRGSTVIFELDQTSTYLRSFIRNYKDETAVGMGDVRKWDFNRFSTTYSSSTAKSSFYLNGSLVSENQLSGPIRNKAVDDDNNVIGAVDLWHTDGIYLDRWLNGDIAEIIIYNRALSDAERQVVDTYLSNKYFPAPTPTPTTSPTPTPTPAPTIPPGIIPTDGVKLWLRAGDISGLASGATVDAWTDMSGNGNNAVQQEAAKKPKWYPNAANGNPVVRFDGIDDYLSLGKPASLTIRDNITIVAIAKANGANSINSRQSIFTRGNALVMDLDYGTRTGRAFIRNTTNNTEFLSGSISQSGFDQQVFTYGNSQANFYINGNLVASRPFSGLMRNNATEDEPNAIGAMNLWHSNGVYFDRWLNGDVAEVIIYDRVLTEAERKAIDAYVKSKYVDPPASLEKIEFHTDKTLMKPSESAVSILSGRMSDGSNADMKRAQIVYSSDNPLVAQVDQAGVVTAVGDGNANIGVSVKIREQIKVAQVPCTVDGTPPVTTPELCGTYRNGSYTGDVTIGLTSHDNLSGVERIEYRMGEAGDWVLYTAPFTITGDGDYKLLYRSMDIAGNTESVGSLSFKISIDPEVMISRLMADMIPMDLEQGTKNSLLTKLEHGLDSLVKGNKKSAANQIQSLLNEVSAQSGKHLTLEQATLLQEEAYKILVKINAEGV